MARYLTPSAAACLAALLIAIGVEMEPYGPLWQHILTVIAAIVALVGFVMRPTGIGE